VQPHYKIEAPDLQRRVAHKPCARCRQAHSVELCPASAGPPRAFQAPCRVDEGRQLRRKRRPVRVVEEEPWLLDRMGCEHLDKRLQSGAAMVRPRF
jgi:hypothetical protein